MPSDFMTFKIGDGDAGARLDAYLASATEESRNAVVRAIDEGRVTVNGTNADKKYKVSTPLFPFFIYQFLFLFTIPTKAVPTRILPIRQISPTKSAFKSIIPF